MTGVLPAVSTLAAGVCAAGLAWMLVRPPRRLGPRVRPYTAAVRSALGRPLAVVDHTPAVSPTTLRRLLDPLLGRIVARWTRHAPATLLRRLDRCGLYDDVPPGRRLVELRLRQITAGAAGGVVVGAAAGLLGRSTPLLLLCGALGAVVGASRPRAAVDRAVVTRAERLRAELPTVAHVLALHVRVGGGVVQAVTRLLARAHGLVADELSEALAQHRGGRRLPDALEAVAQATLEPQAARLYRLLAAGAEHGSDLADGLLRLADDVRAVQVDDLKQAATRRRAAVLIPIIGILAPVMLLFIAAPLPWLVLGGQ